MDNIENKLNASKKVRIVALDASAAFDVLNHGLVLESLGILGVGLMLLSWLNHYLKDRYSVVNIDGVRSNPWEVDIGAIQGGAAPTQSSGYGERQNDKAWC